MQIRTTRTMPLAAALLATVGGFGLLTGAPGAAPAAVLQAVPPRTPAPNPATVPSGVTITAREQPIAQFLRDLFGRVGRPVVPSPKLTGTVNGVFTGSIDKIYRDIARAFNLVSYDDGAALYVYAGSEVSVQTLNVGTDGAQRIQRQARAQRLIDGRNTLRAAGDGTLVISGTPRFIEQVTALSQGANSAPLPGPGFGGSGGGLSTSFTPPPPQPLEFRVFYLRYARAEDTVMNAGGREARIPGIATILQNLVLDQRPGGSALGQTTTQFGARLVRQSQPRLRGLGLDSVAPDSSQASLLAQSDILGLGANAGGGAIGGGGDVVAPLTSDIVRIEPNPALNAIIVRDVPERMAAYDSLIRALDVEPQIVEVEATIIDINIDKLRELGINWRLSTGGFGALFGNGDATSDGRLLPIPGSRRGNVDNISPSGNGGTISTIIGSQREFLARIRALEQKTAARVIARPQLMTLSNSEAVFDRTRTFYVRVAGRAEVDLFNVTAGTVLRVNPHVFRDHDQTRIRLMVNIEDGTLTGQSIENLPIVERATVATQGMVLDGESLLLGGMTIDSDLDIETKIPLLGDIPVLGNLFKTRSRNRNRTERLFLITPRTVTLGSRLSPSAASIAGAPMPAPGAVPPMPSVPVRNTGVPR